MDITDFLNEFINMMLEVFKDAYALLTGITFWNISLFDFMLSVFLLGTIYTLLVSVARNGASRVSRVIVNAERKTK